MPAVFFRQFADNFERPFQVRLSSGMSGGANDHRDAGLQTLANHEAKISLRAVARAARVSRTEVVGSGVSRSGVAPDEMRALLDPAYKGFLSKS